jgi:hypothetical protein
MIKRSILMIARLAMFIGVFYPLASTESSAQGYCAGTNCPGIENYGYCAGISCPGGPTVIYGRRPDNLAPFEPQPTIRLAPNADLTGSETLWDSMPSQWEHSRDPWDGSVQGMPGQ